ncbi:MAG: hypothetical protein PARBA_01092 [Parabacteroides sp.]
MDLTELLQSSPFQGMKEEDILPFLFAVPNSLKQFEPGDIIARQGAICKSLYLLATGTVRAGMINEEGKELTIDNIPGPSLLAPAFIFATENRIPVNIEAETGCEVFIIGKERFLNFMHEHPQVMENFLKEISDRSVFLSKKLNEFALLNLKTRLLKYLETHPAIHNQQEVAQKLGVTRPSLARALSELISEGKIKK